MTAAYGVCIVALLLAVAVAPGCRGATQSADVQAAFPYETSLRNVFPSWDVDESLLYLIPPDPTDVR